MAQAVFSSPVKKVYGESVSLTTTAAHLLYRPTYHEVMFYCASAWRLGLAPKLASVKYYNGTTYTDYTTEAIDRVSTTHVPLDAMAATKKLYLGVTAPVRGFYFNIATNVNANAATLDMEYCYDVSRPGYLTLTGTVSGALTVGELVTGSVSGATGTLVYDDGSTYIVLKDVAGTFALAENAAGATQACNTITARAPTAVGTGYFTDVGTDADGTDTGGVTLSKPGLYGFDLPAVVEGILAGINGTPLYWYRFAPSATLSAAVDAVDIIPACDTVNYAYMQAGISEFAMNVTQNGAFEFDHVGTDTLYVDWIQH